MSLRLVEPDDAGYIYGLRQDGRYNTHLSSVNGDESDQRAWIERYKEREANGTELYFVIERLKDGQACGAVRLYDIANDCFTWGSWVLDENKPAKAALESALLIYQYAFEELYLGHSVFDVRQKNTHALAFHERFGAVRTHEDDLNVYFEYLRIKFLTDKPKYMQLLGEVEI